MNSHCPTPGTAKAVTLLEMTIVILVLLTLTGIGFMSSKKINEWKLGRQASETLRAVYSAQRMYLADRPTAVVANIQASDIIPYLTNGATSIPTVTSLEGTALAIKVNVSPPVITGSSGGTYDPPVAAPIHYGMSDNNFGADLQRLPCPCLSRHCR